MKPVIALDLFAIFTYCYTASFSIKMRFYEINNVFIPKIKTIYAKLLIGYEITLKIKEASPQRIF